MDLNVRDSKDVESRINDIEAFQKEFPNNPYEDVSKRYVRYIKNIQDTLQGSEPKGYATVETILNSPLLADSFMLKTKDGRVFYTFSDKLERNKNRATTFTVEYAINGASGTNVCTLEKKRI